MLTPTYLVVSFLAIIMADDVSGLLKLLSTHPELLNSSLTKWNENPLFTASKHGCLNVLKEIARLKPELAREKDQSGYTIMHLASITGNIAVVKALLELDINLQLCLLEDNTSMIPLQTAVMEGHGDVIIALIQACPNSLERVTYRHETLFHLALKNYQFGAFQFLMEETKKLHQDRLRSILNRQDDQGNTALHIATANKFIGIVNLLLPENPTGRIAINVNSMNNRGHTPLDLYYQNISRDAAARKVSHLLQNAGANEGRFFSSMEIPMSLDPDQPIERMPQHSMQTLGRNSLHLVFYVMVVGAAITIVCSPPSFNLTDNSVGVVFQAKSFIYGELPTIFYLMMFNTAGFMLGMGFILILLWSICFRIATLLTVIVIFIIYGLMLVENKVLKFSVIVWHCNLSAVVLVWLSGIAFILSGALVLATFNYIFFLPCCYKSTEEPKIETFNQIEKQQNFQPGTLISSFAKMLMGHCMAPRHWGSGSPGAKA